MLARALGRVNVQRTLAEWNWEPFRLNLLDRKPEPETIPAGQQHAFVVPIHVVVSGVFGELGGTHHGEGIVPLDLDSAKPHGFTRREGFTT